MAETLACGPVRCKTSAARYWMRATAATRPRTSAGARGPSFSTTHTPPGDGSDIGAFEAGGYVRLTSLTRTNSTAHLHFTKDATTAPVPVYHVQRRAAFGIGDWENLPPGPIGSTNTLVPFLDATATNAQNFYRVRVGP